MSKIAKIHINNIEVGSLPAEEYEAIVKAVKSDWRVYLSQALNILRVALRLAVTVLRLVPWAWFVLLFLAMLAAPTEVTAVISALQKASPEAITHGIQQAIIAGIVLSVAAVFVSVISGNSIAFGFVDHFNQAINQRLRYILEEPAEGDVMVIVRDVPEGADGN